jgi:DNA-binding CsgD family transcriptional regulator
MKLSPRIQQVCELTLQGHSNKCIAEKLGVSIHSIKLYKVRLYRYLGVHTKQELRRKIMGEPVRIEAESKLAAYQAYRVQGLSYKEIGRLEGVTPDHVRTYVYRYGNLHI